MSDLTKLTAEYIMTNEQVAAVHELAALEQELRETKERLEKCEAALKEMQSEAREAVHMLNCAKVEGIALAAKKRLADACDAARAAVEEK